MSTTSLPLAFSPSSRRSLPSISPFLRHPKLHLRKSSPFLRNPSIQPLFASVSVDAPKMAPSQPSFLDHKESGVLHFFKYHGLGNDFIMVDNRESMEPRVTPEQAMKICNRNFGVGADGVIFVMPGFNGTDYTMRIFNSDGSEPEMEALQKKRIGKFEEKKTIGYTWLFIVQLNEGGNIEGYEMCGNGVRCFARFIVELENLHGMQRFRIHTGAGLIIPEIQNDGKVKVDMGQPILVAPDVPTKLPANHKGAVVRAEILVDGIGWNVTCVSMGNPHCVTFSTKQGEPLQVDDIKLEEVGPKFEYHEMFPSRTNTEFVQVFSRSHLKMRVWERGAGATLACGTGACAVVVAAVLEGHAERICTVDLPGGPLEIEWREEDNHVYMTGPAEKVFYGSIPL